jgi:type II secretory pathway component GspD/PulD (secretin)
VSSIFQFIGPPDQQVPWVVSRTSKTTVRVKSGETIFIAGLMAANSKITQHKVPFLGDVPYIGPIFRHKELSIKKTDLIIQITPHIVDAEYTGWEKADVIKESEDTFINTEKKNQEESKKE